MIGGKYTVPISRQRLYIHDPPTTSSQSMLYIRGTDTSSNTSYPNSRYVTIKTIGTGSVGFIYEGFDTVEKRKVIIKKIPKVECWSWMKELNALITVLPNKSGRLLKYVDFYESNIYSYIVTEFYESFDLFMHIIINVPYSFTKSIKLGLEMAKCVKECHDINMLHLDVKCENYMAKYDTLFVDGEPKIVLIDFGHAQIVPSDKPIDKLEQGYNYGTLFYVCPEGNDDGIYSSKSDIWSLAVCLVLVLTGEYPFVGNEIEEYMENCRSFKYNSLPELVHPKLVKLVHDSLHPEPSVRPDIDTYIKQLSELLEA